MDGIIGRIRIYPEKGSSGLELTEAKLTGNRGIQGDFHAGETDRQLSLRFSEIRGRPSAKEDKGLCISRFKENILICPSSSASKNDDLSWKVAVPGTRLTAGEAILEISGETKHCYEECALYSKGKICSLAGQNLFAKVVESGLIRLGDRIASVK